MKISVKPTITAGHSRQERVDAAKELARLVVERYGDAVVAVVIAGSVAVDCDGPYSDLDMTVVTYTNLSDQTKCYTWKGLTINFDYQTVEESLEEAAEPYVGGCWQDVLPVYDPHGMVGKLADASRAVTVEACRTAFAVAMGDGLITYAGKVRNAAILGDRQQMVEAAVKFGEECCVALLGLNSNCSCTGSVRICEVTKSLPVLPPRFGELIDIVRAAVPSSDQQLYGAVEDLWQGLRDLAMAQKIAWEKTELQV